MMQNYHEFIYDYNKFNQTERKFPYRIDLNFHYGANSRVEMKKWLYDIIGKYGNDFIYSGLVTETYYCCIYLKDQSSVEKFKTKWYEESLKKICIEGEVGNKFMSLTCPHTFNFSRMISNLPLPHQYDKSRKLQANMISWLNDNSTYKVYYTGWFDFWFECEEDMMAFKLRWV